MARKVGLLCAGFMLAAGAALAAPSTDTVMGNWEGKFATPNVSGEVSAKIIAEGDNNYRAIIEARPDGSEARKVELTGKGDGRAAVFIGKAGDAEDAPIILGEAVLGKFTGRLVGMGDGIKFEMNRVEKKSPTLGEAPPEGAVVLFDGANQDLWEARPPKWSLGAGYMEVSNSQLVTTVEHGAQKLHLEFKTPLMPTQRGQGRGNSGVYVLGRYEVQVLDSFGLPPADNEAGGIYKKAVPKVNASLPPGEWQTYDITFHPAKFDDTGKKTENARITVLHNGIVIHDNVELDSPTPGGVSDKDAPTGPLLLQHHGNPVQFRNIWLQPLTD